MSTGAPKLYGPPWTGCTFHRPDPTGPWICSSHNQGAQSCALFYLGQLKISSDLLLERARQAEELLKARDEALRVRDVAEAREMEYWVALASASAVIDKLRSGQPVDGAWFLRLAEVEKALKAIPTHVLAVHKARLAVVEAAKEWHAADRAEAQDATLEALERIENAVDDLKKLEAQR